MKLDFMQWDVFTDRKLGGNPLGIFPEAGQLDGELMQQLAREMNLSESTFITQARQGEYEMRIFSPLRELKFAGHPVVGTSAFIFKHLEPDATQIRLKLQDYTVNVNRVMHEGRELMAVEAPPVNWHGLLDDVEAAADLCHLPVTSLAMENLPAALLDIGPGFCIIPVKDRAALEAASCNLMALKQLQSRTRISELTLFCYEPYSEGAMISTRVFAPAHGVHEDPATGSSACCLAYYLYKLAGVNTLLDRFIGVDQGYSIRRPSRIYISVRDGEQQVEIRLAGQAVQVASGVFEL